ncbi:TPA: mechanosensitive ion channel protein MscS [Candidatus Marinimicrobia bacterium]|nr:MAG: mechanosensitive ion channel MscS [Marinimicrobia bacterium 46_43]HAE87555.1 mechanosensitive ion channel protein MscS [Candidatus Neomarinimicrobiota bacterium]HBY19309.1 mechanosensitive ion channel protein MscS [Candidatus Neomarinimicrobiota bacterium]
MEKLIQTLKNVNWISLGLEAVKIVLILVVAWIVIKIIKRSLKSVEKRMVQNRVMEGGTPTDTSKRVQTLMNLTSQGVTILLWAMVILMVLTQIGVEIGPLLAGAGIFGLAIGFGAQNLVKDVISGFFMILEDQIRVGDVAILNGTGGLVEKMNFRVTVLRDLSGTVHVFPNGSITTLSNRTNEWSAYVFDVGVAYKENTDTVTEVIQEVLEGLKKDEIHGANILDAEIFGVDGLNNSSVTIKGRIRTIPLKQWVVGREFLRRVKLEFDARDIEIPFPHQTLYFGEASKPFELQVIEKISQKAKGIDS